MSEMLEHEIEVALLVTTTREDIDAALARSGITSGALIGEALILSVDVYSPGPLADSQSRGDS
jgi:hypothetical protein